MRINALRIIGAALLIGIAAWINLGITDSYSSAEGISPLRISETANPQYGLHILFIGNSYTFVHDIPRQLVEIASSDSGNTTQYTVQSITRGGTTLKELWDGGQALSLINGAHWDYVVLQQHSWWAISDPEATLGYMRRFDGSIRSNGGKTLIYLTWPRKPGSFWYTDPQYSFLRSPEYMLGKFVHETYAAADTLGAQVVPVGLYWWQALKTAPEIDLYGADSHHPSAAGAYLAALTFYKTLSGRDVTHTAFAPPGVKPEDAEKIRAIVAGPLPEQ